MLNHMKHISWRYAIFLVLNLGVLSGCAGSDALFEEKQAIEAPSADQKLAVFEQANPECKLWTNWEQMCSRSNANGEAYCVSDPDRKAAPSEPFCTDSYLGYDATNFTEKQTESVLRFCDKISEIDLPVTVDGEGAMKPFELCLRFQSDRPFNGKRVASRLHPWCQEWSDSGSGEAVCSTASDPDNGAAVCQGLANAGYEHENRLYCSAWTLPAWCREGRGYYDLGSPEGVNGMAPNENAKVDGDVIYFGAHAPLPAPVYGVQCGFTQEQFDEMEEE